MKKVSILGMLLVSTLLASCSRNEPTQEINSSNSEAIESTLSQNSTFENGVLESKNFTLEVKSTQTIKSPYYEDFGLFVTFNLTNNSEESIIPDEILMDHIIMKQKNDSSIVELDNYYDFENSFGDDIDTYNQQVEKYNSMSNELLPGKKMEIYGAYTLDNLDHSVEMMVLVDGEEFNGYKIEISDVTPTVENQSSNSNTEITNSVENQVATPPASQASVSDMPPSWREGEDEWEKAKSEGWTAEDWEAAVKASENETYVIESESPSKYSQAINEGATEYQAQTYADGWVENWRDAPSEIPSDIEYLNSLTDEELDALFEVPEDNLSSDE